MNKPTKVVLASLFGVILLAAYLRFSALFNWHWTVMLGAGLFSLWVLSRPGFIGCITLRATESLYVTWGIILVAASLIIWVGGGKLKPKIVGAWNSAVEETAAAEKVEPMPGEPLKPEIILTNVIHVSKNKEVTVKTRRGHDLNWRLTTEDVWLVAHTFYKDGRDHEWVPYPINDINWQPIEEDRSDIVDRIVFRVSSRSGVPAGSIQIWHTPKPQ